MTTRTDSTLLNPLAGSDPESSGRIPVFARRFGSWHLSLERHPYETAKLTASYDLAAARWHKKIDRLDYLPAYAGLLKQALAHRPVTGSAQPLRALDCGTGTGALSEALAGVYSRPVKIDAIDVSPAMLDKAAARLRDICPDVVLREADVQKLPYADDSFDIVMAGHILEHLPHPVAALQEMVRAVRPGGLVFACITRRTLPGLWIHLLWRTHMVSPSQAEHWFHRAKLQRVRCLMPDRISRFRTMSVACCGIRAENAHQSAVVTVKSNRDQ